MNPARHSFAGFLFVAAIIAGCSGSSPNRPGGMAELPPDQNSDEDASSSVPDAAGEKGGSSDAGQNADAVLETSVDVAIVDEAADAVDAIEAAPPLCAEDGGGPAQADETTPPASAPGICKSTLHATATMPERDGQTTQLVGLTPDLRTIAWFEAGTLNCADRPDATSAWGPGYSVGRVAPGKDRPALSGDGLRIVVVNDDGHGFSEYVRPDRQSRFGADPSDAAFAMINAQGLMLGPNQWFGSPVVSADDHALFYLRGEKDDERHTAVYESRVSSRVAWPVGTAVVAPSLDALCGRYRRPTALSSDALTLFYWDEVTGTERATFRASIDAPFAGSVELGVFADGVIGAACDTLYFTTVGGGISVAALAP